MKHKNIEITHVSQYCLEATPLVNFAKKLPSDIKMSDIRYRGNHNTGRHSNTIPEALKKAGLQSCIALGDPIEVRGVFKGVTTPAMIQDTIRSVAKLFKVPVENFYIIDVTLADKQNTSVVTFHRMYKSIKLPNDKRKRKLVLGMKSGSGLDYHGLLAELGGKKVTCTFGKVEKTIVMCSEESVVKK